MSRLFLGKALTLALVCGYAASTQTLTGATSEECLKHGDSIGVFYVTKVAGAEGDGVEPGEDLCYRCRYGSSPMIMVFARDTSGKVPELIRNIEEAVVKNEESSLKGLVTLMGEDGAQLKKEAEQLAEVTAVKKVPIVVAKEVKTGPLNYKLPSDAAVTIVVGKDSQVFSTHVSAADQIDIAAVMSDVTQVLD